MEFKLELKDRLIISNQLLILEKLYPEEASYYEIQRKAVESGYELHYHNLIDRFSEGLSEKECEEVLYILEMYSAIAISYKRIANRTSITEHDIIFPGFDGNNETELMLYTRYFINDLDRYEELRGSEKLPDFNSHTPMLDRYREMKKLWDSFPKNQQYLLNEDQIRALLKLT